MSLLQVGPVVESYSRTVERMGEALRLQHGSASNQSVVQRTVQRTNTSSAAAKNYSNR